MNKTYRVFFMKNDIITYERASNTSLAPNHCHIQNLIKKCLPAGGGLQQALPQAGVGRLIENLSTSTTRPTDIVNGSRMCHNEG